MATRVDDLRVGMWVAITATEEPEPSPFGYGLGFPGSKPSLTPLVDGKPLKIVALSLPFICVTDGHHRHALDVRNVAFQRLSPKYVKALLGRGLYTDEHGMYAVVDRDAKRKRKRAKAKDERVCPICGERMHELLSNELWYLTCSQCGFRGGRHEDL